jgi:hypothetical protein
VTIRKKKDAPVTDKGKSVLQFRNITICRLLHVGEEQGFTVNKNYKFPFVLKTQDRTYCFMACSEIERDLWLAAFNYVKISTDQSISLLREKTR